MPGVQTQRNARPFQHAPDLLRVLDHGADMRMEHREDSPLRRDRGQPVSDVFSHHRALTTCHLANIAIRVGRPLKWDPVKEQIVKDSEAQAMLRRQYRQPFVVPEKV